MAPNWTADWLHREAIYIRDHWAGNDKKFADLDEEQQAQLSGRLAQQTRANTYDPATRTVTIGSLCAEAFDVNLAHYSDAFSNGNPDFAIPRGASVTRTWHIQMGLFWIVPRASGHELAGEHAKGGDVALSPRRLANLAPAVSQPAGEPGNGVG